MSTSIKVSFKFVLRLPIRKSRSKSLFIKRASFVFSDLDKRTLSHFSKETIFPHIDKVISLLNRKRISTALFLVLKITSNFPSSFESQKYSRVEKTRFKAIS